MKKKVITLVFLLLLAGVSVWMLLRDKSNVERDYPEIVKDGVLNIVTDYNSVGYFVSGDTVAGFNHDLIKLLSDSIGLDVIVTLEADLNKTIEGLRTGKYDVIASNTPITSELRSSLGFTEPITQNKQVLIQRKKEYNDGVEPLRSHLDLAKKTIYVSSSSPAILRIKNLSHEIGDTIYIKEDPLYNAEQLAMLVASKDIDFAVCDEKIAKAVAQTLPEIDYATLVGFTHLEAWAVRGNAPVLLDSLNTWIERVKSTDRYKTIYQKYYK